MGGCSQARVARLAAGFLLLLHPGCGSSGAAPDGGPADAQRDVRTIPDLATTADGALGARADIVIGAITRGDAEFLWERPALTAAKYGQMATNPFAFFRGSLALFLQDWNDPSTGLGATQFPAGDARPMSLGDAHFENFGILRSASGRLRVEPNDFDVSDRMPYLWDVRRFAVGACLAALVANAADPMAGAATAASTESIVRAAVTSYADTVRALAAGGARPVVEDGGGNPVLDDLFARAAHDDGDGTELREFTVVTDGVRTLLRGTPDPTDPGLTSRDLPARSRAEIPAALAGYLPSLPVLPSVRDFVPLDAVQLIGRGIGSLPRLRALGLVRGPSTDAGDDLILEIKELPSPGSLSVPGGSSSGDPRARVAAAMAAGWTEAGADPFWGTGIWLGTPVQMRSVGGALKTVRVSRLEGPLGTTAAIEGLATTLARLIARMHAAAVGGTAPAVAIADDISRDPPGFVDEQTEVALAYCGRAASDWQLFTQALTLLGPTLGVTGDPAHASTAELRLLFDPDADPRSAVVDPVMGPVTINEISATTTDFIELVNVSSANQNLGGFAIADAAGDAGPRFDEAVRLAPGTTLRPGARILVAGGYSTPASGPTSKCPPGVATCYQASWEISAARAESVFLLTPADVIADQATYPLDLAAGEGQSWGRLPDGAGPFSLVPSSPGAKNLGP